MDLVIAGTLNFYLPPLLWFGNSKAIYSNR